MRLICKIALLCGLVGTACLPAISVRLSRQQENQAPGHDWNSPENEVRIGKTLSARLETGVHLLRDPSPNAYIQALAERLGGACSQAFPITAKVIDSDYIDAIALPGGFLYVTSEMIRSASDEAELSGALAHQIGHICTHQFVRAISQKQYDEITAERPIPYSQLRWMTFSFAPPPPPLSQSFPAAFEAEADEFALQCLQKAGYDTRDLTDYFTRVGALEKEQPGSIAGSFYTHLSAPGRNRRASAKPRWLQADQKYIVNTSDFETVKARLIAWTLGQPRLFAIRLATPHLTIKAGSHLKLGMTLKNVSNNSIGFHSDGLFPYTFHVLAVAGMPPPETDASRNLEDLRRSGVAGARPTSYYLQPGETINTDCVLDDYYDMSKPGTYFIQAEHGHNENSPRSIRSNTIKVTVLP